MDKRLKSLGVALLLCMTLQAQGFEMATEAVRNMGVGWNLGNTLDAHDGKACPDIVKSETMWGQPVTQPKLLQMMQQAGFGAIRVPVTWYPHMDAAGKVDEQWMKRVHEVVDYVLNTGMYCILNVHHDTGEGSTHWLHASMSIYNSTRAKYEYLWRQIATEFKDYGEKLLFESYNEMLDKYDSWCFATFNTPNRYIAADAADAYQAINSYAQSFVDVVRETGGNNAQRNLVVNTYGACCGSGTWNSYLKDPLKQMKLPEDDTQGHLIFEVHSYPSVKDINSAKTEINDMFSALKTYLADKGAPVIIGEWGTANDKETDYDVRRPNVLTFADYFVKKARDYGFATFWWMGLSDGTARSLPAFSQPDLAETILQAYHGDDFEPTLPAVDDYEMTYTVNYTSQWQELNLCDHIINLSDYQSIRVELGELPLTGYLSVKIYGEADGKEQYSTLPAKLSNTINFNRSTLGSKAQRITLQYCKTGNYSILVNHAFLIKANGTEEATSMYPFWGCTVEAHSTKKPTGIDMAAADNGTADDVYFTLSGQRTSKPGKGLYLHNGRKMVIK